MLFTTDKPIIFAYHGYPWLIHRLTYRRTNHKNLHVRGYKEEGTTTTPFDMVVLNRISRYHLAMMAVHRVPRLRDRAPALIERCQSAIDAAVHYARQHFEDPPDIQNWVWTD